MLGTLVIREGRRSHVLGIQVVVERIGSNDMGIQALSGVTVSIFVVLELF